jgi:sterol-4alpha-carboxylate 3-dehydrogenase (decarboxylating)
MSQQSVLVVGGCGFIGYHIVRYFVEAPEFSPVSVLSRSALQAVNKVDGATYIAGDLNDRDSIERALQQARPAVIVHAASPSPVTGTPKEYQRIVVEGTRSLLKLTTDSADVQILIYTSSSTMAQGREHLNVDERAPLADTDPNAPPYARAKALAERMVLDAYKPVAGAGSNSDWSGCLSVGALRYPICYGTHDAMTIPGSLLALEKGQTRFQLGDGQNLWNFCSTDNVGRSHVLLARALLAKDEDKNQVGGEAFNIHDGQTRPFWDFPRAVWKLAGHKESNESTVQIPVWFVSAIANVLEFVFWAFTFGRKRPQTLGKQQVEYACYTHTYDITKAKKRLGYVPRQNFEEDLSNAVAWSLNENGWAKRLKRSGIAVSAPDTPRC